MLTIKDIPIAWKDALGAIHQLRREAVIGGGALRDLDNRRPIKDIDIFVHGLVSDDIGSLHDAMVAAGFACEEYDPAEFYPIGDGNDVIGYFEAAYPGLETPLQIIVVQYSCTAATIVERFDYGICRIAFDGRTLFMHPDYVADQTANIFRLCIDFDTHDPRLPNAIHRYARLSQKYEGWCWRPFSADPDDFC